MSKPKFQFRKPNKAGDSKPAGDMKKGSPIEILPYAFGDKNMFKEWATKLEQDLGIEFGNLANLIRTDEFPVLEPPEEPADDANAGVIANYVQFMKEHRADLRIRGKNMYSIYMILESRICPESRSILETYPDYPDVQKAHDTERLWQLIKQIHIGGTTGLLQYDKLEIRKQYAALKQRAGEDVFEFVERTRRALEGMEAAEVTPPTDEEQALDFIDRLDPMRFGSLQQATLHNDAVRKDGEADVGLPLTLRAAAAIARRFKMASTKGVVTVDVSPSSVFFTDANRPDHPADKKKQKKKKQGEKKPWVKEQVKPAAKAGGEKPKKSPTCYQCLEPGHVSTECPNKDAIHKLIKQMRSEGKFAAVADGVMDEAEDGFVFVSSAECVKPTESSDAVVHVSKSHRALQSLSDDHVLLDNQANVNLVRSPRLLTNIRTTDSPIRVNGIGGVITSNVIGTGVLIGLDCYLSEEARMNIWSFSIVTKHFRVSYIKPPEDCFVVYFPNGVMKFIQTNGLYVGNINDIRSPTVLVQTVTENQLQYTKRQVDDAKSARDLAQKLGHVSNSKLVEMLKRGDIVGTRVTTQDVVRAEAIFGPSVAALKGKTRATSSEIIKREYVPRPMLAVQNLLVDVMFVEGIPYLLSISIPLGLMMVWKLISRATNHVLKALIVQINAYKSQHFVIGNIGVDGEGAVAALAPTLNGMGITTDLNSTGIHAKQVEHRIQWVKTGVRAHISVLPYTIPFFLLVWLVYFCVSRINILPSSLRVDATPPKVAFTGVKTNVKNLVNFSAYAQVFQPSAGSSMLPRTQGALMLLPLDNEAGTFKMYSLSNNSIISRDVG